MCGQCCKGAGGIVVSPADLTQLSDFLHMSPEKVIARYAERYENKLRLRIGENGYCIFFQHVKGCSVHESKPAVCRAWPFFRGNIIDPTSLDMAKDFCPGINSGVTYDDFANLGRIWLKKNNLLASDPTCEANTLVV
ncbi:MAG: YkgJ family cysteine cluster protein [Desulfovibrio sp.]|jgi:Fe-S-cluster containining protein|nr:YkgJ family cysteine cluster protein [Desulfovibrio sp.]